MKTAEVVRIRKGRIFRFAFCLLVLCLSASPPTALGRDDAQQRLTATRAPMEIPHVARLEFDARAARKRAPRNLENHQFLDLTPGLVPFPFPRNSDVRARILTPELRRTPVVGWIAANLYRDRKDSGWCLELDPGEGEYVVFYRAHLKK